MGNLILCAFADEASSEITEQVQALKDNGIGYIEVRGINGKNVSQLTEKEAKAALVRHNRLRKRYHNSYCEGKWGDSRCYDICINSSRLGFDGTVKFLEEYIRERMKQD